MLTLISELSRAAAQALRAAYENNPAIPDELLVQAPARQEFGDFQVASCLQLARPLGKKPRDLAQVVKEALKAHPAVEKAEVAGPGYVNLHLRSSWLEKKVAGLLSDPRLGLPRSGTGHRVVVDFSSPNVAKPMHIAHIRSTIIGDAMQRVLRALDHEVVSDNHLGDWGTQFGKLIVAYRRWLDKEAYARAPIVELVRLYQKFVEEDHAEAVALGIVKPDRRAEGEGEAEGEEKETRKVAPTPLLSEARAELVKLQQGDVDNLFLWREFVAVSMKEFEKSYQRLGVRFDVQLGESYYNPRLPSLVEELLARGIAEASQGAAVCHVEGEPAPLLIRKGDGSFLYGTTDLATIEHRVKTWDPARILYVVDGRQQMHFRQVFAVARKMGFTCELLHVWFGTMRFRDPDTGDWGTGSTRKGNVPLLEEFLNEALRHAEAVAREQNAELSETEVQEVARVVGLGAVKYNDLCRDRQGDVNFDVDQAMSLKGNTATYIQYAYARIRSIGRKAGAAGGTAPLRLGLPAERALARKLLDYPGAVLRVGQSARPHHLTEYLYDLAGVLSTFYNDVPVLKAEAEIRASRLVLLETVARTLKHGLDLLGIEVLERM